MSCRTRHGSIPCLHKTIAATQLNIRVPLLTLPQEVRDQIFDIVIQVTVIKVSARPGRNPPQSSDPTVTIETMKFQGNKHLLAINCQIRKELLARTTTREGVTKPVYTLEDLYGLFTPVLTFQVNPDTYGGAWRVFAANTFFRLNVQNLVIRVPERFLLGHGAVNDLLLIHFFRSLKCVTFVTYWEEHRYLPPEFRPQFVIGKLDKYMKDGLSSWPVGGTMRPTVPRFELVETGARVLEPLQPL